MSGLTALMGPFQPGDGGFHRGNFALLRLDDAMRELFTSGSFSSASFTRFP